MALSSSEKGYHLQDVIYFNNCYDALRCGKYDVKDKDNELNLIYFFSYRILVKRNITMKYKRYLNMENYLVRCYIFVLV